MWGWFRRCATVDSHDDGNENCPQIAGTALWRMKVKGKMKSHCTGMMKSFYGAAENEKAIDGGCLHHEP